MSSSNVRIYKSGLVKILVIMLDFNMIKFIVINFANTFKKSLLTGWNGLFLPQKRSESPNLPVYKKCL